MNSKTVLITGATGGIGNSLAAKFGAAGAHVVLWDIAPGEETIARLAQRGITATFQKVDITDRTSVEGAVKEVMAARKGIDVLVNNAGITRDRLLLRMEEDDWDQVLAVNLKGSFLCSKMIGKEMMSRRCGTIVNIASVIGQIGNIGQANYAASKAGLIALTKTSAREFARYGVRVNAIAPGFIMTKMTEHLPEKVRMMMLERIPLDVFGSPDDVADCALFLASDSARYITGQVVRVDGGLVM